MRMLFPKGFNERARSKLGVSTQLPPDARNELVMASKADLSEREVCLDRATIRVQRRYPQFFQQP